jgi:hypothetical protein
MSLPYTIANGQTPDGDKVQANFAYMEALVLGNVIKTGTYAAHRVTAASAPATAFVCIATDESLFLLYCGNVARGDGGFFTIIDFKEIA